MIAFTHPLTHRTTHPLLIYTLLAILSILVAPHQAAAESDLFRGFEQPPQATPAAPPPEPSFRDHLGGYFKTGAACNYAHTRPTAGETDWRGLSRLRTELQLEADYRLRDWKLFFSGKGWYDFAYTLRGRSGFTREVLNEYEREAELRDAFLQGSLRDNLDLKLGRQVVVWGRSDNFRVTDVLNPLDNRDPGLTDIEDLRLPRAMSRADFYSGPWNLSLIAIHEHRFDKTPPFGHDFYPTATPALPEKIPAHTLENTELATALHGVFSGWDLSFYGARVFHGQPTIVPHSLTLEHQRLSMAGAALSAARGNILYILEAAHLRGLRFFNNYGSDYNRTDLLAGIEYAGLPETTIAVDIVNRHLHDFDRILADSPEFPRRNDLQAALRITRNFMQNRLQLVVFLVAMGARAQHGSFERLTATYDLADAWSITGGLLLFQSGTGFMADVGDNDRVFLELRYDF